jgi:hypothetical protein
MGTHRALLAAPLEVPLRESQCLPALAHHLVRLGARHVHQQVRVRLGCSAALAPNK